MSESTQNPPPARPLSAADWRAIIAQSPLLFDVISDSMRPTFSRGERVRIRSLEDGEPQIGQVVAFMQGLIVTHRYVGRGRYRGDNTLAVDRGIDREAIVGIVIAVSRDGKDVSIQQKGQIAMALNYLRLVIARRITHWRK